MLPAARDVRESGVNPQGPKLFILLTVSVMEMCFCRCDGVKRLLASAVTVMSTDCSRVPLRLCCDCSRVPFGLCYVIILKSL